jgi:16S rRNA (adenine1518-N6/adenine1519-N6)-dimethyltransferase
LKFNFDKSIREKKVKVFGNIPYYISSPIIERLAAFRKKITAAYITVQKDFALRVVAAPGSKRYGSFSCFVQYHFKPSILFNISRGCFNPVPKVDSAFLELIPRKKPPVAVADEERLFRIIRAAFNQRRKILRNSLSKVVSDTALREFLAQNGLDRNVRPEELNLSQFAELADI